MRNKSNPGNRAVVVGPAVESLETRRLLAYSAGRTITPGVVYRPASDAQPTVAAKSATATKSAAGKTTAAKAAAALAFTNYVKVLPQGTAVPSANGTSSPVGLTATEVRRAYGMDNVSLNGVTGNGAGQTIAIIAAFDHPGFVSSSDSNYYNSDLSRFSSAMGLPDFGGSGPTFTKIDQTGGTNYPSANADWAAEIAMNVEWAHALAPMANIVLVEAATNSFGNLVQGAANYARSLPGVTVVSMSFGAENGSFSGENFFDPTFTTPSGHAGVTFVAATGDNGAVTPTGGTTASGIYPAESPNVVAVGGTNLTQNGSGYVSEYGWSGSGGGISNFEAKPTYQSSINLSSTFRTTPDVSMLADPNTGVAVYDSYNNTSGGGWNNYYVGGTSLAAPLFAGVVAVANQGRANIGLDSLRGSSQTLQRIYQLPAAALHDITSGYNGYNAGTGYDLVTGRGTPTGQATVTSLAGGTYTGITYVDNNNNGVYESNIDSPLGGVTVINDADKDGTFDGDETSTTSNAQGVYTLDLTAGVNRYIRSYAINGYRATSASAVGTGLTAYGSSVTAANYGFAPTGTSYTLANGQSNTLTIRINPSNSTQVQVFQNVSTSGTPTFTLTLSAITSLTVAGGTGDDTVVVDLTYGSPLPSGGISFSGASQSSADTLAFVSPSSGSTIGFGTAAVSIGGRNVTFTGVEVVTYAGGSGNDAITLTNIAAGNSPRITGGGGVDSITVVGGTYQPNADLYNDGSIVALYANSSAVVSFSTLQRLTSLDLSGGAVAKITGTGNSAVLRTSSLNIASNSALDVGYGAVILDYSSNSPASTVSGWVTNGYAAGLLTGNGIRSSAALADRRYAVASEEASVIFNMSGATFFGQDVDTTTVLIRYTTGGDANFDGTTNFNDFIALQTNYGGGGKTYAQGDFDHDGDTDFNDFIALQTAYGLFA